MSEYICDDRVDYADYVKQISEMSEEEFDSYLNQIDENKKAS